MNNLKQLIARNLLKSIHKKMKPNYPQLAFFNYDLIGRYISCEGYFEENYLQCLSNEIFPLLDKNGICLDIGANIGNHSLFFSRYFNKVFAYEPNLRPFKLLEANSMICNNIRNFNIGLSDKEKVQKIKYNPDNIGAASLNHDDGNHEATFTLKRLDDILIEDEKKIISFMKIDVEGYELEVLYGAEKTIKKSNPIIAIEVLPHEIKDGTFKTKDFLNELGYRYEYLFYPKVKYKFVPKYFKKHLNRILMLVSGKDLRRDLTLITAPNEFTIKEYPMIIFSTKNLFD